MDPMTGGATIPGVEHHQVSVNGTELHYISAGTVGSPVMLVHGFPETWWVFRKLIPYSASTTAYSPPTFAASATPPPRPQRTTV